MPFMPDDHVSQGVLGGAVVEDCENGPKPLTNRNKILDHVP